MTQCSWFIDHNTNLFHIFCSRDAFSETEKYSYYTGEISMEFFKFQTIINARKT